MRVRALLGDHLRPYRGAILGVCLLQFAQTMAMLLLPNLNARIIDEGIVPGDTAVILQLGAVMLGVSAVQVLAAVAAVYVGARTAMSVGRDVRQALFTRVQRFSTQEISTFGTPSLITRSTNDVQQLQMLVLFTLVMILTAPIMLIGGVIMAVRTDAGLSVLVVAVVPALALAMGVVVWRAIPLFKAMQKRIDGINRVMREQLSGIRVIRAFVKEPREATRFTEASLALEEVAIKVGKLMALSFPLVMFIVNGASVLVIWFGGQRVDAGQTQVGALVAFLAYLMFILMSVMLATMLVMFAPRAMVSAGRIQEVLESVPTLTPPARPTRPEQVRGEVRLENVSFGYPGADADVLHELTFTARPGQTTAIIGSTGAGKSTVVNLVPRLFDASGGRVLIDGVDLRDFDPDLLSTIIGLVPQRPYLFSGTVASNLAFGREDASEEEMWQALRIAQGADFVAAMDGGLDAEIAQGGTNVSGGQRQRLAIARALIRKAPIYLFDDSFSALDYTTDAALRAAMRPETSQAAVIVVAQRVATIRDADQILVLEHGRLVGSGTHSELLAGNETYAEIVNSQLSAAEAAR
ncbi:MAG TPA: ABC transporter ATP-binding protein [Beutenbergiaceae bacterium]|nr:ABC transporter ATP-binding protein [Beutenbergiaceae bacterium]